MSVVTHVTEKPRTMTLVAVGRIALTAGAFKMSSMRHGKLTRMRAVWPHEKKLYEQDQPRYHNLRRVYQGMRQMLLAAEQAESQASGKQIGTTNKT